VCVDSRRSARVTARGTCTCFVWRPPPPLTRRRIDKRFYKPCTIDQWAVCIYETRQRFNEQAAQQLVTDFLACCQTVGVPVVSKTPPIFHLNAHLSVQAELAKVGGAVKQASGKLPSLLVIVLPEGAQDLYVAIKQYALSGTERRGHSLMSAQLRRHPHGRRDTVPQEQQVLPSEDAILRERPSQVGSSATCHVPRANAPPG
jgi:hypothetical protein